MPVSFFDRVIYVGLAQRVHTDFTLLNSFSEVVSVNFLNGGVLSNEFQVERGFLPSDQSDGKFTRAMQQLTGLTRLQALCLADSHVSDAALDVIADLPAIEVLDLGGESGVNVGNAGLRHISRMKNLRVLYLKDPNGWYLNDSTVPMVAGISTLEVLSLSSHDVTDRALTHLARLTNLRELNLAKTAITGRELSELKPLRHLERLVVSRSVEAAAKNLEETIPGLTVAVK